MLNSLSFARMPSCSLASFPKRYWQPGIKYTPFGVHESQQCQLHEYAESDIRFGALSICGIAAVGRIWFMKCFVVGLVSRNFEML